MTRINAFIQPAHLCDQHLLAEHREIVRIPNTMKAGKLSDVGQPSEFKLGAGHVKFFRDKLKFLHHRYNDLHRECVRRGFNVSNMSDAFHEVPLGSYNNFTPSLDEVDRIKDVVIDRIIERMPSKPRYTNYKIR